MNFIGRMGGGKTLSMTIEVYKFYLKGYKIYANYGLNFPYIHLDKDLFDQMIEGEEQLSDCVIAIDEMHIWMDSRNSKDKKQQAATYFALQTRKRNVILMLTTQNEDQVDKRLRRSVDILVFCENISIQTATVKKGIPIYVVRQFLYRDKLHMRPLVKKPFLANPYFCLYDTNQIITRKKEVL